MKLLYLVDRRAFFFFFRYCGAVRKTPCFCSLLDVFFFTSGCYREEHTRQRWGIRQVVFKDGSFGVSSFFVLLRICGCEASESCTPPAKYAFCRYFVRLDRHEKRLVGEGGSAHAFRSVFNSTRLSRFLWLRVCRTYLLVKFCTHLEIVAFCCQEASCPSPPLWSAR